VEAVEQEEKGASVASLIGTVRDEEQARKERIADERIVDDRAHHVKGTGLDAE